MLAYSPVADRVARRIFADRPNLKAFAAIRESWTKLVAGIAVAWLLGGFLEELVFRGVVLQAVDAWLGAVMPRPLAATLAIVAAALGASVVHLYQGKRASLVIFQLSVLF